MLKSKLKLLLLFLKRSQSKQNIGRLLEYNYFVYLILVAVIVWLWNNNSWFMKVNTWWQIATFDWTVGCAINIMFSNVTPLTDDIAVKADNVLKLKLSSAIGSKLFVSWDTLLLSFIEGFILF